jgi:hypothetical protein
MANAGWTSADSVNWDEVSTEAPPPLADNLYEGLIAKAEPRPTKDNKPAISIELSASKVFGGEELERARKVFDNLTLTKEAAFRVKQLAAAANVEPPKNFGIDAVTAFCDALVESEKVIFRTRLNTYKGKTNAKVVQYHTEESAKKDAAGGEQSGSEGASEAPVVRRKRAAA